MVIQAGIACEVRTAPERKQRKTGPTRTGNT